MTTLSYRLRHRAADVVAKIDEVSKQCALTDDESRVLEHFIGISDGTLPARSRAPQRANIILARMGILRDVSVYRPNKKIGGVRRHTEGTDTRERLRRQ